jgi:glutamyl-tRNA reductase
VLETFHSIVFSHRNLSVDEIGLLHIAEDDQQTRLTAIKQSFSLPELMFLSTCNRVEYHLRSEEKIEKEFLESFFQQLYPQLSEENRNNLVQNSEVHSGIEAVEHLLRVASSIDSLVIGEREIITQVRNAFELSKANGLTGDFIRLLLRHTIETAKQVYTQTSIATKPVSIVSLAYHRMCDLNIPLSARVLIVGAGVTNTNMSKFLKKHGFKNFAVFNRTLSKAQALAEDLKGTAYELAALANYDEGFDVLLTCTGSEEHVITPAIYKQLLQGDTNKKVVIDLALPQDLDPLIKEEYKVNHISVNYLQEISAKNLAERSKEVEHVEQIIKEKVEDFKQINRLRKVELAMREVPQKVKDIRSAAVNEVFKNELANLDDNSKEVLEKVIDYMEKKYMSMPMLMAKEILLNNE